MGDMPIEAYTLVMKGYDALSEFLDKDFPWAGAVALGIVALILFALVSAYRDVFGTRDEPPPPPPSDPYGTRVDDPDMSRLEQAGFFDDGNNVEGDMYDAQPAPRKLRSVKKR